MIDSIAAALGAVVPPVTAFLPEFTLPDDTITFRLLAGGGIPLPLPREEALETRGALTTREEFRCARARGE